jgi:hypothetical protein
MKILKAHTYLCGIELSQLKTEFLKVLDHSHQVTTWHEVDEHEDDSLVLGHCSKWKDERMVQ